MKTGFCVGLVGGAAVLTIPFLLAVFGSGKVDPDEHPVTFSFGASVYCGILILGYFCYLSEESDKRDDSFWKFLSIACARISGAFLGCLIPLGGTVAVERFAAYMIGY